MYSENRRAALGGLVVVSLLATFAWASDVTLPHTFTAGTTARAAEVNGNFSAVKVAVDNNYSLISSLQAVVAEIQGTISTINSLLAALASRVSIIEGRPTPSTYFAEQLAASHVTAGAAWIDVPGAAVTFSTPSSSSVDVIASGAVTMEQTAGTGTFAECLFKYLIDGSEFPGGIDPGIGSLRTNVGLWGSNTAGAHASFTALGRATVQSGTHTVKLQMRRGQGDGNCVIWRWSDARVRMRVDVH